MITVHILQMRISVQGSTKLCALFPGAHKPVSHKKMTLYQDLPLNVAQEVKKALG